MGVGTDRTVIGNDPQDAPGLLAALVSGVDWIRLGLRRIGKRGFRIGGRSRRVGRLRCGGGIGWSLLRAEFVREWTREQQEWQEKNQLLQNLLPPIIIRHHGEKFPGFPAPDRYRHWIQVVAREMHLRHEKNRYG